MPKPPKKRAGNYSRATKEQCAAQYAVEGNISKVARDNGIVRETVQKWAQQDWWVDLCPTLHHEKTDELRAKYVDVCELAIDQTKAKLPEATASQAAVISGVFFDKTRLIDNAPTSISAKQDSMSDLVKKFEAIANDNRVLVIDQTIDDKT